MAWVILAARGAACAPCEMLALLSGVCAALGETHQVVATTLVNALTFNNLMIWLALCASRLFIFMSRPVKFDPA